MNIKKTLGILTLTALGYMGTGCEQPADFSQARKAPAVYQTAQNEGPKPADKANRDYKFTHNKEGSLELEVSTTYRPMARKWTIYKEGAVDTEGAKVIDAEVEAKVDKVYERWGRTFLAGRKDGRKVPVGDELAQINNEIDTDTYGRTDSKWSVSELTDILDLSDSDFKRKFSKVVINENVDPTDYGGVKIHEPTFQELLDKGEEDGAALNSHLRNGKSVSDRALGKARTDSDKLRDAYNAEAAAFNREYEVKAAAEKARWEAGKR